MGKIKLLTPELINLIAAGEVVERPASVVKELVENSIDADATRIGINIEEGGSKKIEVVDNGVGMDKEDAVLALTQHATSKLATAQDLNNIHTLGFRGEALASISSVAKVEIDTKTKGSEAVKLSSHKDKVEYLPSSRIDIGTTITVHDLFKDVPARQKFLRSQDTEFGHILTLVQSLGLANLGVHFELYHNSKLVLRLPVTNSFSERIFNIWNSTVAEGLYQVDIEKPGYSLTLAIGKPDIGRKDRKLQFLFVNKRLISDRLVQKAISEAYKGYLHRDLYPVYFVFLNIDPTLVDVNVHPRKQEVRFNNTQQVYSFVYTTIRNLIESSTKKELSDRLYVDSDMEADVPSFIRPKTFDQDSGDGKYRGDHKGSRGSSKAVNPVGKERAINYSLNFTKELLKEPSSFTDSSSTDLSTTNSEHAGSYSNLPNYFKAYQLFNTYIVYEKDDSVIFVDQHAAAEKILYEKFKDSSDTTSPAPLLVPLVLDLLPGEKEQILKKEEILKSIGIEVSDFGGDSLQVLSLPELTPKLRIKDFLEELLSKETEEKNDLLTKDAHYTIATLACHGAIRAGQPLTESEMRQILSDLNKCKDPYNCPHGRPVSWVLAKSSIEKEFVRKL